MYRHIPLQLGFDVLLKLILPGGGVLSEIKDASGKVLLVLREDLTALDDLDLSGAVLDGIQADGLICMGTIFDRASFKAANLYWMIAIQASFRNAILDACVFSGGTFAHADFSGASLKFVGFRLDNLGGRTDLCGADLSTAVIDGADFIGASCDSETKFPAGFDPVARGLIIEPLDR